MSSKRNSARLAAALALLAAGPAALAAGVSGLPFDPSQVDPNSLVSQSVVDAVTKAVGLAVDHRPYEPATPLGTSIGLDFSIEATLVKIPDDLFTTLQANGMGSGGSVPFLPVAKIHLHKGMGDYLDIGGSFFYLPSFKIIGTDLKFILSQGEEGPTWALRLGYNYADLNTNGVDISTKTFTPALLVSRQLDFADPYLGAGVQYAIGDIDATVTSPVQPPAPAPQIPPIPVHGHGSGYGFLGFVGVSLRIPRMGVRLTPEMAYSSAGAVTMGAKVGFTF